MYDSGSVYSGAFMLLLGLDNIIVCNQPGLFSGVGGVLGPATKVHMQA